MTILADFEPFHKHTKPKVFWLSIASIILNSLKEFKFDPLLTVIKVHLFLSLCTKSKLLFHFYIVGVSNSTKIVYYNNTLITM